MVPKRPRGRILGFETPSWMNNWFENALVEEYVVSTLFRGRLVSLGLTKNSTVKGEQTALLFFFTPVSDKP